MEQIQVSVKRPIYGKNKQTEHPTPVPFSSHHPFHHSAAPEIGWLVDNRSEATATHHLTSLLPNTPSAFYYSYPGLIDSLRTDRLCSVAIYIAVAFYHSHHEISKNQNTNISWTSNFLPHSLLCAFARGLSWFGISRKGAKAQRMRNTE